MSLITGQIVRYGSTLWRVELVNESRARIVPLAKRHVVLDDGREFDAERSGVNISPNSPLDVITDVTRARDEIELAEAEAELQAARAELAREERAREERARVAPAPAPRAATLAPKPRGQGGWRLAKPAPAFRPGTLAAVVFGRIQAEPGLTTQQLVDVVKAEGNVKSCVSRFHQAGLIEKVDGIEKS